MIPIQTKGTELLEEKEKQITNKIIDEYYPKIQRQFKNLTSLTINFKGYKKQGKNKKYSINIKAIAPTKIFEANASDWNLTRTLHKVMNKLKAEIEHKLHVSEQHIKN